MATYCTQQQKEQMMEQFVTACRDAGLKVTHQRTEIYRQLVNQPDHPTAETLHKRLLATLPTISLDTVYRTLTTLEQHGLVARIQTAESQARFEAVYAPHHHLICSRCKRVVDFQWPDVDTLQPPADLAQWGQIDSKTIVMHGVCSTCSGS
ncbi:MAG: transcriptional repressor [Trichlorobacter sp.]|uniref:Fur family transcriptional regulator n=1 Tax=Trichlorobacter sp. TaxID=2911007 RepID=UPI00255F846B|nr:transcriptional repressor [Trichlorobacter sp.]